MIIKDLSPVSNLLLAVSMLKLLQLPMDWSIIYSICSTLNVIKIKMIITMAIKITTKADKQLHHYQQLIKYYNHSYRNKLIIISVRKYYYYCRICVQNMMIIFNKYSIYWILWCIKLVILWIFSFRIFCVENYWRVIIVY